MTIPDSVKTIDYEAFYDCNKLTEVKMGKSVTTVDGCVFENCERLQSVTLSPSLTAISRYMFGYCTKLTSIVIPDSVQTIEYDAFDGCTALREVVMGKSVTLIDEEAFYGCTALPSITLPASLKTIGEEAFGGCNGLTSLVIPDSVTLIDEEAFCECYGLTSLTLGSSVETLAYECFRGCDGLTSIVIPDSVKKIGSYAFENCTSLKTVTLLSRNPEIGSSPFNGCTALKTVNYAGTEEEWNTLGMSIPEGVTVNYGVGGTLPTITTQPTDVVGKAGSTATFTVKATGEGLTYQWQLSDDNCATWRDSSTQAATYTAAISTKNQNRALRCVVKDKYGRKVISNAAFIRLSTLAITTQPVDTVGSEGGAIKFTVKADGEELTYQWQLSDDAGKTWRNSSTTSANYTTTLSSTNNGRWVRCIVTDKYGVYEISNAAAMKISTLAITTQPASVTSLAGKSVTFTVAAKGDGLTYQWQLSDDQGKNWRDSSTKTATYTTTLSTTNSGRYVRCIVTDKYGAKKTSNAAYMKISSLAITAQPVNASGKIGDLVKFTVTAKGPSITYQWQLSDDKGTTWRDSSNKTAEYATTLSNTNNGRYVRCVVTDKYGNSVKSNAVSMSVKAGTPLAITTQPSPVTALTGDLVTFTVKATGDGLTYQWQLSDDQGKTWRNSSNKTATYSTTLNTTNSGRYVRCVVTDKYGASKKSDAAYMKISSLAITGQPMNVTGNTGELIKFTVTAKGPSVTYQWQLSDDAGKTWRNSSNKTAEYATTLSSTNNGRYVRCIVTDKYGNSVKSNAVSMKIK